MSLTSLRGIKIGDKIQTSAGAIFTITELDKINREFISITFESQGRSPQKKQYPIIDGKIILPEGVTVIRPSE